MNVTAVRRAKSAVLLTSCRRWSRRAAVPRGVKCMKACCVSVVRRVIAAANRVATNISHFVRSVRCFAQYAASNRTTMPPREPERMRMNAATSSNSNNVTERNTMSKRTSFCINLSQSPVISMTPSFGKASGIV